MTDANRTKLEASKVQIEGVRLTECHFVRNDAFVSPPGQKVQINAHFGLERSEISPLKHAVTLSVETTGEVELPFEFLVAMQGTFSGVEGSADNLAAYMRINAVASLVPYIREMVTSLTTRAGLRPFILPPVNVHELVRSTEIGSSGPQSE